VAQMLARDYVGLGECAFCGFQDAGHRVWDAIAERLEAGESERSVAEDYDLSIQGVRALARRSNGVGSERSLTSIEE